MSDNSLLIFLKFFPGIFGGTTATIAAVRYDSWWLFVAIHMAWVVASFSEDFKRAIQQRQAAEADRR